MLLSTLLKCNKKDSEKQTDRQTDRVGSEDITLTDSGTVNERGQHALISPPTASASLLKN